MGNVKKIVVLLCLFVPFMAAAQTLSNKERRHINMRLLNLVEQYESSASLYDDGARCMFLQLFDGEKTPVYSDMLDYAAGQRIGAAEYARVLGGKQNVSLHVMNVSHDDYVFEDGRWTTTVTFDKSIVYNDANGILFSSPEYYKSNYSLSLKCVYDKDSDRCLIASIDGTMNSERQRLPEKYVVVNHTDDKVDKIMVEGSPLEFNSFDQAFAPAGAIRAWNDDIRIKADTLAKADNYDFVNLKFRKTHWRAKIRFAYALGSVFKVSSPMKTDVCKSSGFEAGAELGYNIPLGRTTSMGIFFGAAYSSSKLELGLNNVEYSYRTMDRTGRNYTRHYRFDSITEGVSYSDIAIPVYLNFDHKLVRNLYLSWNVGAKIYLNGKVKVQPYHLSGTVYGDYNGNIVSSQPADALGDIDDDCNVFLYPDSYNRNTTDLSVLGGLSLSYNIFRGSMFVFLKYSYEYGLTDVHKSDGNALFDADSNQYPMVYSAHRNANVATRSFMDCVSYKRQTMWLELGMMFKF